jgi:hypothetical protein
LSRIAVSVGLSLQSTPRTARALAL